MITLYILSPNSLYISFFSCVRLLKQEKIYSDFTSSLSDGLIQCLILLEDSIPTAFMVYTTEISEALELNIIHCLGDENVNKKRRLLMDKFMIHIA